MRPIKDPRVTLESLFDGTHQVLSRATATWHRALWFVKRPSGAFSVVTIELDAEGQPSRVVGTVTIARANLPTLDAAMVTARRTFEKE